jgi:cell division initiation protein
MSITALEIQEIRFGEVKKGYNPNEVDEFLERVATDVDTLNRALAEAASRIKAAEARAEEAERRLAEDAPAAPVVETRREEGGISEDVISKAFIAAQKSADALQAEARKEAEKVYRESEAKGRDIVREALAEKQKMLAEVDRLRESSEQFRTEYLSLLKHFQADAQKRLTAFDELIPARPDAAAARKAQERLTAANDATVSPSSEPRKSPVTNVTGSAPAGAPLSPIQPPAALAQADDEDELDIEEID